MAEQEIKRVILPLERTTLFTLEGCPSCGDLIKLFQAEIEAGEIEVKHCDSDGTAEEKENCYQAILRTKIFDGFPLMVDKAENKLF